MAETAYIVLSAAHASNALDTIEEALQSAAVAVDKDRTARLVVQIVSLVKPRAAPNVDVVHYAQGNVDG